MTEGEEKTEEEEKQPAEPNKFTDSKGRDWFPRVTVRSVDIYERRIGKGLFEMVLGIAASTKKKKGSGKTVIDRQALFDMFGKMFGSVGALGEFLYESCRNPEQRVVDSDGNDVSIGDFCDSIQKDAVLVACTCALNALFDFFPDGLAGGGGEGTGPFGLGPWPTVTD